MKYSVGFLSIERIAKFIWTQTRARFTEFGFFANRLRPQGYVNLQKTESVLRSSNLRRKASFAIPSIIFLLASCASNTGTGVIAGTVLGAGIGGLAGGGKGALIGSATGAIAGGLIGAVLDQQDRKVMERSSPRTVDRMDRGDPLTINDVIKLSQSGVSDDSILVYMRETSSTYNLSQAQIRRLQESGASQRVINYMVDSAR